MKSNVTYCEAKASNQVGKKCSWNEQFKRKDRKKDRRADVCTYGHIKI